MIFQSTERVHLDLMLESNLFMRWNQANRLGCRRTSGLSIFRSLNILASFIEGLFPPKVFRAKTLLKRSELIKLDFFGGLLRLRLNSAPSSTTERKFKRSVILGLGCWLCGRQGLSKRMYQRWSERRCLLEHLSFLFHLKSELSFFMSFLSIAE